MSESPEEPGIFFITEEEAGNRLDKILAARLSPAGSRTYFQFLIDEGKVLLNGMPVKKRVKPKFGDEVEVEYILNEELKLTPENIPLKIVYEDEWIIVVDKPAGMVVHPATGNWTGTFINALLFHCKAPFLHEENSNLRPGIVHRLDKDTTGLIVAAKTNLAQSKLIKMFSDREVNKKYLAICIGNPGNGSVDAPIGRHPADRKKMAVVEEGKAALTHYKTLKQMDLLSLVDIIIETGRTHQIRVHMKHLNTPVLGDSTYGNMAFNKKVGIERQMLHAYCLQFKHPITDELLNFESPVPDDMNQIISKMGKKLKG